MHAFCESCLEIWLEKSDQCPTCHTHVGRDNPCRRVLGAIGVANNFASSNGYHHHQQQQQQQASSGFNEASTRKARYLKLFQLYEDEIDALNEQIDYLSVDAEKLKVSSNANYATSTTKNTFNHDTNKIMRKNVK